jgi:hypothetical protein
MRHFFGRLACFILGHRANYATMAFGATSKTFYISHRGMYQTHMAWHYEPCVRCGALFCYDFGTPQAVPDEAVKFKSAETTEAEK